MRRTNSQIAIDYKSHDNAKLPRPTRVPAGRQWLAGLAALALAASLVLFLIGDDPSDTPPGVTPGASSAGNEPELESLPLTLPPPTAPDDPAAAGDTASTGGSLETDRSLPGAANDTLAAPAPPAPDDTLTLTIGRGDTLDRLFRKHNLSVAQLHAMLALPEAKSALTRVKPGDVLSLRHEGANVLSLSRRLDEARTLAVERIDDGFRTRIIEDVLERQITHAQGHIDSSLFNAGKQAGVSDRLIMALAGIFAWDIDFVLDIRQGDEFVVLYEQIWRDGELLRDGDIIAARFINDGEPFTAVRYVDPEGRADYYTPDGHSVRKAFLRAPVNFSRVSSNFNPRRKHPVLKTTRPHKGVDYAAPTGTAVMAAGDGKVIFRGRKGGYGNCVILQHGGNITTLYAHLSKFNSSAKSGRRVSQGQTIGYVGQTGLASGPHLHYEYRLDGVHRNPRTVKLPQAEPIRGEYREAFTAHVQQMLAQLALVSPTRLARND